jgi:hypothetical protein
MSKDKMSKDTYLNKLVWNYIILSVIAILSFIFIYINFVAYKEEIVENMSVCTYGTCNNVPYNKARANFTTGFTEFNDNSKRDEKLISYISNPPYN